MSGQVWSLNKKGGYLYADELSETLRTENLPLCRFRQFTDVRDGNEKGLHRGDKYRWDDYERVKRRGRRLNEHEPMPASSFDVGQSELTIVEWGNSVDFTGKLESLSYHDILSIIDKVLKIDVREAFDIAVWEYFDETPLIYQPMNGNSTDEVVLATDGVPTITNNVALGKDHISEISVQMQERNIPGFDGDTHVCMSHPSTLKKLKKDLEAVNQYTETGINQIYYGEKGMYDNFRFVHQTFIPKGGAHDSTTYDPWDNKSDDWDNGKSSWAYFLGKDTVTQCIVIPEELRAMIAGDYGRSKGLAWYALAGFGLARTTGKNATVAKWGSAA